MMYRCFQLNLSNFDTGDDVLIPHLTELVPYMGLVLPHMGAHSVSGRALPNVAGCHPESHWGIERTFHLSLLTIHMTVTYSPSTSFSQLSMQQSIFEETSMTIWLNPDCQSDPLAFVMVVHQQYDKES